LYEALLAITKLIAPFVPFLAESLWQHLTTTVAGRVRKSVHLCDYPRADAGIIDEKLSQAMRLLREIASLGRAARMEAKLKVRQPLSRVEVTLAQTEHAAWLKAHDDIVREELNVKEIRYTGGSSPFVEYSIQPNFRRLGPRVGALLPKVKAALGKAEGAVLLRQLTEAGRITLTLDGQELTLDDQDIQVRLQAKSGWAAAQGKECVVVLATELSEELIEEGIARDAVRCLQDLRKVRQCQFADRIEVFIVTTDAKLQAAIGNHQDYIAGETLAAKVELTANPPAGIEFQEVELAERPVQIGLRVIP
jgi:isoleucyl-tRNA synthetase